MKSLFPRPKMPKAPDPVFVAPKAPEAFKPVTPQEGTTNVGSADSRIGTQSLIRTTQRKPGLTTGKRTLLGG